MSQLLTLDEILDEYIELLERDPAEEFEDFIYNAIDKICDYLNNIRLFLQSYHVNQAIKDASSVNKILGDPDNWRIAAANRLESNWGIKMNEINQRLIDKNKHWKHITHMIDIKK